MIVELQVAQQPSTDGYTYVDRRAERRAEEKFSKSRQVLAAASPYGETVSEDFRRDDKLPTDLRELFKTARKWEEQCLFMQVLVGLKIGFYNFGRVFRAVDRPLKEADQKALDKWERLNKRRLRALIRETWRDKVVTDCVIAFWREQAGKVIPRVLTLPAEDVEYTDALGIEKLKISTGYNAKDLRVERTDDRGARARQREEGARLTDKQIKRYASSGMIELSEDEGEFFRVCKRARLGRGLGRPRMMSVFRAMEQDESMQVADNLWAFLSRAVIRHFKIGHEIRNGNLAGSGRWFWDPVRDKALREMFEGRVGIIDASTNFDVAIEYPYPDAKRFDASKYESVFQRLSLWAGPVGMMLMGKQGNTQWLDLLRAETVEEREDVGPFLSEIINKVFPPPNGIEVELAWKENIFRDQRQAIELLKFLVTAGPLSYSTALGEAGYDRATEWEQKKLEGEMMQDEARKHMLLPPYDPAHGVTGAQAAAGKSGGRPAGTGNAGPRAAAGSGGGD